MTSSLIDRLREATDGLVYMSESDEPWEVVPLRDSVDESNVHDVVGQPPDAKVERQSLSDFFEPLITEEKWFGEAEQATAQRYQRLQDLLAKNLADAVVYRVGTIQVDVLIVGRSADRSSICLRTKATET